MTTVTTASTGAGVHARHILAGLPGPSRIFACGMSRMTPEPEDSQAQAQEPMP